MGKITILESKNADTRTATKIVSEEELCQNTIRHIHDVNNVIEFFCMELEKRGITHDFTKLEFLEQFHKDFAEAQKTNCDFTKLPWYKFHIEKERHHLQETVPGDVNLLDVFEYLADCVVASMARKGVCEVKELSSEILEKAFKNTVVLLKDNIEVKKI